MLQNAVRHTISVTASIVVTLFLASCGGGSSIPQTPPIAVPQGQQPGAAASALLYVVNRAEFVSARSTVTAYPLSADGNTAPSLEIAGPATGLGNSLYDAFDAQGNLYVTGGLGGCGPPCIRIFAPGASGNATPIGAICGDAAGIGFASAIAIDSRDKIYVVNQQFFGGLNILVFAAGTRTSVPPLYMLNPVSNTDISDIALDASDRLYVLHSGVGINGSIEIFAPGASGSDAPIATISGNNTGLSDPGELALDSAGNIYVTNLVGETITKYPANSSGNVAPTATIQGNATQLSAPGGIAVDSAGVIYIANADNKILEFAPGSNGDVAPVRVISGANTNLRGPTGLAVH